MHEHDRASGVGARHVVVRHAVGQPNEFSGRGASRGGVDRVVLGIAQHLEPRHAENEHGEPDSGADQTIHVSLLMTVTPPSR